jgi:hypothetical protein
MKAAIVRASWFLAQPSWCPADIFSDAAEQECRKADESLRKAVQSLRRAAARKWRADRGLAESRARVAADVAAGNIIIVAR